MHYSYPCYIPKVEEINDSHLYEIKKSIAFMKYGEFKSSHNFERFGFLREEEIKNLLQLSFRIRNTDYLIEQLLERPNEITLDKLKDLNSRKAFICDSTKSLLCFVVSKNQYFEPLFNKVIHDSHTNSVREAT